MSKAEMQSIRISFIVLSTKSLDSCKINKHESLTVRVPPSPSPPVLFSPCHPHLFSELPLPSPTSGLSQPLLFSAKCTSYTNKRFPLAAGYFVFTPVASPPNALSPTPCAVRLDERLQVSWHGLASALIFSLMSLTVAVVEAKAIMIAGNTSVSRPAFGLC